MYKTNFSTSLNVEPNYQIINHHQNIKYPKQSIQRKANIYKLLSNRDLQITIKQSNLINSKLQYIAHVEPNIYLKNVEPDYERRTTSYYCYTVHIQQRLIKRARARSLVFAEQPPPQLQYESHLTFFNIFFSQLTMPSLPPITWLVQRNCIHCSLDHYSLL